MTALSHLSLKKKNPRLPTFPGRFQPSIIGDEELNYCVRDGNRCNLFAIVTRFFYHEDIYVPSKLNNATPKPF